MKKRTASTKKETPSVTPPQPQQQPQDLPSSKWYQSIFDLPLAVFENCLVNDNLSALVITGKPGEPDFPTVEQLSLAWDNILQEYGDSVGTQEYKMYLLLFKQLKCYEIDLASVEICIATLRKEYNPFFCNELNKLLGCNYTFDVANLEEYLDNLKKCERRSKMFRVKISLKQAEFEVFKKKINKEDQSKEFNRQYFTHILIILSKHNGYQITKDIFVNEYCEYLKQYNEFYKEQV